MSKDKEGIKGTSLGAWSGGEQMAGGEENDTKGDTIGMGPFLDTPPFWTPPHFKGKKARGVWNRFSVIDLGALILVSREMRAQFRTPPPPPLCLKIEWKGGSRIQSRP
jgi:hypothetical protein